MSFFNKKVSPDQIRKNKSGSEKKLQKFASLPEQEIYKKLHSAPEGLSGKYAQEKLEQYGKNVIISGMRSTVWGRLISAFVNPFNIILFITGLVTVLIDVFLDGDSEIDYLTNSVIFIMIFISGIMDFIQSQKSNEAAEKLSKMISNKTNVFRDGKSIEIPMEEVVSGDIIKFSAGDMIPADVRFLETNDTFVSQAALTGESQPVEKLSFNKNAEKGVITDFDNIGFMGSNLISGSATGIVVLTGNDTFFGSMAESLSGNKAQNSFERGVASISKLLVRSMLVMVPVVFGIVIIKSLVLHNGTSWIDALLFAIAVAIGLTPELLPVIMTSTLAKGAVAMSKNNVIVKNLSSIQTFGEMDILCTDKTGTLTEDRIAIEKYMDIAGQNDMRVLHHAYLIANFQTGLKNLIDIAIIGRAEKSNLKASLQEFKIVDEIPFDFQRRRMSVVLQDDTGFRRLITKGAVEEMVSISSFMEKDGQVVPLSDENRKVALKTYEKFNSEGLRMIAIAQKLDVPDAGKFSFKDESNMTLIGFIGFLDPPKESAKIAIDALKEYGVKTVVLTGDSAGVAVNVCKQVGISTENYLTGKEVEKMDDEALLNTLDVCNLFAKLTPSQKERVVKAYQSKGHTVGYMGDGINDAPPMHQADVSISVDSAVDVAKETADIILLKKDLMVLEKGVLEGRKIFGNILKYIKMASSGNFGNMISVIFASLFLPFLPMLPVQIICQNLITDTSGIGIPFDNMDPEYLKKPKKWDTNSIKTFMYFMGPLSSIFDILCFVVMWFIVGKGVQNLAPLFQSGWFVFGAVSQVLVIHMIRTAKIPFVQSRAALPLVISTLGMGLIPLIIGFTDISSAINMARLPISFAFWLAGLLVLYFIFVQVGKKVYQKYFGAWI